MPLRLVLAALLIALASCVPIVSPDTIPGAYRGQLGGITLVLSLQKDRSFVESVFPTASCKQLFAAIGYGMAAPLF